MVALEHEPALLEDLAVEALLVEAALPLVHVVVEDLLGQLGHRVVLGQDLADPAAVDQERLDLRQTHVDQVARLLVARQQTQRVVARQHPREGEQHALGLRVEDVEVELGPVVREALAGQRGPLGAFEGARYFQRDGFLLEHSPEFLADF